MSNACDEISQPLVDPEYGKYKFDGITGIELQNDGSYLLSWKSVDNEEAIYKIYKSKKDLDEYNFLEPEGETKKSSYSVKTEFGITDYCFIVRVDLEDQPLDENTVEKCTNEATNSSELELTSVEPKIGSVVGGGQLTLRGGNFQPGIVVLIGNQICGDVTLLTVELLTCVTPPGNLGEVDVTVSLANGSRKSLPAAFTYKAINSDDFSQDTSNGQNSPLLLSVEPRFGKTQGGDWLTLKGANLNGVGIQIGGASCQATNRKSSREIECLSPALAIGAHNVELIEEGASVFALESGYVVAGPPQLVSLTPTQGSRNGGTTITLTGTGFLEGATIQLGNSSCELVTVESETTAKCRSTAGLEGKVIAKLTNPDGQLAALADAYEFLPGADEETSDTLNLKPIGDRLVVVSETLSFDLQVLGAEPGDSLQYSCESACPSGMLVHPSNGTVTFTPTVSQVGRHPNINIKVSNGSEEDAETFSIEVLSNSVSPSVTYVTPNNGPISGGTAITIIGQNFVDNSTVLLGDTPCGSVTYSNPTQLDCVTPAGTAGATDVLVRTPAGLTSALAGGFEYNQMPVLNSISPANGPVTGAFQVTITGSNFIAGATVTIGGQACTSVAVTATQAICFAPALTAGSHNVVLSNPDGQSGSMGGAYTTTGAPTIASVSPSTIGFSGTDTITLTGTDFLPSATILVGTSPCTSVTWVSSSTVTCVAPTGNLGAYPVQLTNTDGQSVTEPNAVTFQQEVPTVSAVNPNSGRLAGGTTITITGADFFNAVSTTVTVGGKTCNAVTAVSPIYFSRLKNR